MNLPEVMAALTIAALGIGVGAPQVSGMVRTWKLNGAARDISVELSRARMEAVARAAYVGIRFERTAAGDRWRLYLDGGDRGIRSSEIASGVDAPLGRFYDLAARYPGVRLAISGPGAIPRIPPSTGVLTMSDDPVAFGASDLFSAAPTGETSTGTIYLSDGRGQRAVVVFGATGRIRVWRYDPAATQWKPS